MKHGRLTIKIAMGLCVGFAQCQAGKLELVGKPEQLLLNPTQIAHLPIIFDDNLSENSDIQECLRTNLASCSNAVYQDTAPQAVKKNSKTKKAQSSQPQYAYVTDLTPLHAAIQAITEKKAEWYENQLKKNQFTTLLEKSFTSKNKSTKEKIFKSAQANVLIHEDIRPQNTKGVNAVNDACITAIKLANNEEKSVVDLTKIANYCASENKELGALTERLNKARKEFTAGRDLFVQKLNKFMPSFTQLAQKAGAAAAKQPNFVHTSASFKMSAYKRRAT